MFFKPKPKLEPNSQSLAEHQSNIGNEVEKATTSAQATTSNQPSASNQPTTSNQIAASTPTDLAVGALDTKIRWALKVVMMHASYRLRLDLNQLFEVMFSDSDIAKKFPMSKTKVSYVIIFGLADFFYNSLTTHVKKSSFYSLLFDESLNKVLSKEQMDLQIRFYD